jgi:hypothetical protein
MFAIDFNCRKHSNTHSLLGCILYKEVIIEKIDRQK